jgi:hypothetical protein
MGNVLKDITSEFRVTQQVQLVEQELLTLPFLSVLVFTSLTS